MKTIMNNGYILAKAPEHPRAWSTGYVYEHIIVAEQKLGRFLVKGEHVHHIDECRTNNHPDNLLVMTHSEHARLHGLKKKKHLTKLRCDQCKKEFLRETRNLKFSNKHNYCNRVCYVKSLSSQK